MSFWGCFPNPGMGKWLMWLQGANFPFFSPLLTLVSTCGTGVLVEVCLCTTHTGNYFLALFLSSLPLWSPQRCTFLSATAAFKPLSCSSVNSSAACLGIWQCLKPLAITQVTKNVVLGVSRWCCEEQHWLLLCLSKWTSAEEVSLFLHTKQRWLFITSVMSKLPRQRGHKTCWISSVDDEGTSSSCAIGSH